MRDWTFVLGQTLPTFAQRSALSLPRILHEFALRKLIAADGVRGWRNFITDVESYSSATPFA